MSLKDALDTLIENGLVTDEPGKSDFDTLLSMLLAEDNFDDEDEKREIVALAWNRSEGNNTLPCDVELLHGNTYKIEGQEFLVVTDEEADELWEESLENYLDECVEGADGPYFDREAWKRDARFDGRGHCLNHYDGSEYEIKVGDDWWYFYRQN